jgi:Family of unknown function (DUF6158)
MVEQRGLPAEALSDSELERQGARAHATRNWVFLHGTAEQFRRHTERMLELEQEYLRRHPKRTWQGSEHADAGESVEIDQLTQVRQIVRSFAGQIEDLLGAEPPPLTRAEAPDGAEAVLLARFAATAGGRMHKLEAHQLARELGATPAKVASLYRHDPPLLATAGSDRFITSAGRAWLAERAAGA